MHIHTQRTEEKRGENTKTPRGSNRTEGCITTTHTHLSPPKSAGGSSPPFHSAVRPRKGCTCPPARIPPAAAARKRCCCGRRISLSSPRPSRAHASFSRPPGGYTDRTARVLSAVHSQSWRECCAVGGSIGRESCAVPPPRRGAVFSGGALFCLEGGVTAPLFAYVVSASSLRTAESVLRKGVPRVESEPLPVDYRRHGHGTDGAIALRSAHR